MDEDDTRRNYEDEDDVNNDDINKEKDGMAEDEMEKEKDKEDELRQRWRMTQTTGGSITTRRGGRLTSSVLRGRGCRAQTSGRGRGLGKGKDGTRQTKLTEFLCALKVKKYQ